jgi:M6 family metalloprotease-like protein
VTGKTYKIFILLGFFWAGPVWAGDRVKVSLGPSVPPRIPKVPMSIWAKFPKDQVRGVNLLEQKRERRRHLLGPSADALGDTLRVLVLKVEFKPDADTNSYGDGRLQRTAFQESLDASGKKNILHDPVHNTRYFQRQMEFLRNFYLANAGGRLKSDSTGYEGGKVEILWDIYPKDADSLDSWAAYTVPHQMGYYSDYGSWYTQGTNKLGWGLGQLFVDAIHSAETDVPRFQNYDGLFVIHAGVNLQVSAGFAIQSGYAPYDIPAANLAFDLLSDPFVVHNGTDTVPGGSVVGETNRYQEAVVGLQGTVVHEFGHQLGIPDLYDVFYESAGLGNWEVMAGGGYNGDPSGLFPCQLTAWPKKFLGWVSPQVIQRNDLYRLRAVENLPQTILKVPINSHEYFLLENKQTDLLKNNTVGATIRNGVVVSVDQFDSFLPGSGLLIYHVDEDLIRQRWKNNELEVGLPKAIALMEADGIMDLQHWTDSPFWNGDSADAFSATNNPRFADGTTPSSKANNGTFSHITITDIGPSDTVMPMNISLDWAQPGFPQITGNAVDWNSPMVADLKRDGQKEIVLTSTDGRCYAWHLDGSKLIANGDSFYWYERQGKDSIKVLAPAAIIVETDSFVYSTPAIGNIDSDNLQEIVFGSDDGYLYALKPRARYDSGHGDSLAEPVPGFPKRVGDFLESSPLLVDLNGDNRLDIVFGSHDRKLHAWWSPSVGDTFREMPGFPVDLGVEIVSSPAAADLFGDGQREIVVLSGDGRLFVLGADGKVKPGWPQILARLGSGFTSPVIGDIDRDETQEIMVASAVYTLDKKLYAFKPDGSMVPGWPASLDDDPFATPALGDIDQDGYLEAVVSAGRYLYAFNYNGSICTNFPIKISDSISVQSSPTLGDVDGDGNLDIVVGSPDAKIYAFNGKGKLLGGFPLTTGWSVLSSPTLVDISGDVGLAVGCDDGFLYVYHLPYRYEASRMPWPIIHQNILHTGLYPAALYPPAPAASGELLPDASVYAYPNPVRTNTRIRYSLGQLSQVKVEVYTLAGELVSKMDGPGFSGTENEVVWDAGPFASGVYFCRVEAKAGGKSQVRIKKIAVVK